MKKTDRVNIPIQPDLKVMATEKARLLDVSLSQVIREFLREWLARPQDIKDGLEWLEYIEG